MPCARIRANLVIVDGHFLVHDLVDDERNLFFNNLLYDDFFEDHSLNYALNGDLDRGRHLTRQCGGLGFGV